MTASETDIETGGTIALSDFGERICVVGMGGKTSLSRALGYAKSLDVIHLDEIGWMPNWTVRDKAEQLEMMREAIEAREHGWVVDGNLSQVEAELILPQADTVVWLHLPHFSTWWNVTWRSLQRARHRKQVCGENYETFPHILGKHSMIWWGMFSWRRSHQKIGRVLSETVHDARIIELRSYRELNDAYAVLGADPAEFRAP